MLQAEGRSMGKAGFLLVGERGQRPFFPLSDLKIWLNNRTNRTGADVRLHRLANSMSLWRASNADSATENQYGELSYFV